MLPGYDLQGQARRHLFKIFTGGVSRRGFFETAFIPLDEGMRASFD
jgi:hypothetical protein